MSIEVRKVPFLCPPRKALILFSIWLIVGLPTLLPFPLLAGTLKKRNPAFVIPIESILQKLKENQDIILIDVRKKDEFEKFSIPGSINIPLFAVKTAPPFSFYSFFS
ncbi:MAG: rhodanese-like domain-containing protein [Deltaproteobacteria bacterium]|nr:rhodanese-like domain-containing protein [Deltaproteobacteria bacterium]